MVMDRQLLSKILTLMKTYLKENKPIGDLKLNALASVGHQLEAIFYYLGHELGSTLKVDPVKSAKQVPEALSKAINEYHIGIAEISESSEEIVQLKLRGHSSSKDLINKGIKTEGSFCSFEAGLLAGIVEAISSNHCFAQELNCALQSGNSYCEFMIVFQKD